MTEPQPWAFSDVEAWAIQQAYAESGWPACPRCGRELERGPSVQVGGLPLTCARCPGCHRVLPTVLRDADDAAAMDRRRDAELRRLVDELLGTVRHLAHHVQPSEPPKEAEVALTGATRRLSLVLADRRRKA